MHARVSRLDRIVFASVLCAAAAQVARADEPHVEEMTPKNGATNVSPMTAELRVYFDTDMDRGGYSVCGSGPTFPEQIDKPKWMGPRFLRIRVKLEPDHSYELSLNCPSAMKIRSIDGTPLKPVRWTFKTASQQQRRPRRPGARPEAAPAKPPKVVELVPKNGATDVDPTLTELRVTFDRPMTTGRNFSYCGGGRMFPNMIGEPKWLDNRTIVAKVELEADHDYELSLNCPSARAFRSAEGVALEPAPWSFSTAAKTGKLSRSEQKKLNSRSLKELVKALREHYSYYELRGLDWKALEKVHRKKIGAAKSTRSWVSRVAKMLSDAKDMHLWLTYRGKTTATYTRKIKRNYHMDGIKKVLPSLRKRNKCVFAARTDDDIGYVMIGSLSRNWEKELEEAVDLLAELKDCKGLIIDLRANGGGAEPLAMPIAAWFVDGEKTYAKHAYRDPDSEGGFTKAQERKIRGNGKSRRFGGPVAVLSGRGVMSSAEAFLLMLRQGEDVKVFGSPTFGSSGNPKPQTLENGVEVFIPSWKAMRPDGSCFEGEGIEPDVRVKYKSSKLEDEDPVLEAALAYLRERAEGGTKGEKPKPPAKPKPRPPRL